MRLRVFHFALFIFHFSFFIVPGFCASKKDYDREIAKQRRELDELKARLLGQQRELEALRVRKAGALERLDRISGNIRLTEQYLRQLEAAEETLVRSVTTVRREMG